MGLRQDLFRSVEKKSFSITKAIKAAKGQKKQKLELEQLENRELMSSNPILLDFGTATSPVATNYVPVTVNTFNSSQGFGWQSTSQISAYSSQNLTNPLTQDGHQGTNGTFQVNLDKGIYQVQATLGNPDRLQDQVSIIAEGKRFVSGLQTAAGEFKKVSFQVEVTDGRLNLNLSDAGGVNPYFSLAALDIQKLDEPLTISPVGNQAIPNSQDKVDINLSATAVTTTDQARALDRSLDLRLDAQAFNTNYGGKQEKWLKGNNNASGNPWYFITPDGSFYAWDGRLNKATGTKLATFNPLYYSYPNLLYNASLQQSVTFSVAGAGNQSFFLDRDLNLTLDATGHSTNYGGKQEKWFRGVNNSYGNEFYFILPDGSFCAWDGTLNQATGTQLAKLDPLYHQFPDLLYNARQENMGYVVDQGLGLTYTGNPWMNWGGQNEQWVLGRTNSYGNGWYFIKENGQLFAWDGTANSAQGTFLTQLDSAYWNDIGRLADAVQENWVTTLNNNTLTLDPGSGFIDPFIFEVKADDKASIATTRFSAEVTASAPPLVANAGSDQVGDEGTSLKFSGSATGGQGSLTYSWDFGDGTTGSGQTPTHTFADNGNYTVYLTVTDGQGTKSADSMVVAVNNVAPTANAGGPYNGMKDKAISFAGSASDPGLMDTSAGFAYLWNFGDGTSSNQSSSSHTYSKAGTYTVSLKATDKDGASTTTSTSVTVNPVPPVANAGPDQTANEGASVSFSGSATGGEGGLTYSWDFGDGTTGSGQTSSHTYADNGIYTATLTVTDSLGQVGKDTLAITVNNVAPTANAGGPYSGSPGVAITFSGNATDPSSTDTTAGFSYLWNFGDGTTSTQKSPSHVYLNSGNYSVSLKVTDKDGASHTTTTSASITSSNLVVDAGTDKIDSEGNVISFSGSVTGGQPSYTWAWNFGDGTTGSGQTLNHTFADNGIYTVTLSVTDSLGRQSSDTLSVTINNVAPTAISGGPYAGTTGSAITFNGNATDPSSADTAAGFTYLWSFGDGTTSTQKSPSHSFATAGTYTVTLKATDKDGASHTVSTTAAVSAPGTRNTDPFIVTPYDKIPNFGQSPTIYTVASGNWSDVSIWSSKRLPTTGDVVSIDSGFTVSYDTSSTEALKSVAIQAGGHLIFRTDISTKLTVQNFLVLENGELQVGTVANPVAANVKAEIIFPDIALDTVKDPSQYGNGLIGLGKVTMYGATKSDTFVRLAVEPKAGDTTLTLATPVTGWQVGDRLVVPDSRQLAWNERDGNFSPQWELGVIQNISTDGKTITLQSPLQNSHLGARNGDGVLEYLPHVGVTSRNINVKSQNSYGTRGYAMFTQNAQVDIHYAGFFGLGRTKNDPIDNTTYDANGNVTHIGTNQQGRYAVYFHQLITNNVPESGKYRFTFEDNTVLCPITPMPFKWGIAIQNSDYGLIKDNVLYNWAGAGIVTEDGSEDFNVIEHNFVVAISGNGASRADSGMVAREGSNFWFAGTNNYIRGNVATNGALYGYTFFGGGPFLEFARNESYGGRRGLTMWYINGAGTGNPNPNAPQSTIKDFVAWNNYENGVGLGYPVYNVTFDGVIVRGDQTKLDGTGWYFGDYLTQGVVIKNADIQGMRTGIEAPLKVGTSSTQEGVFIIENSYLRNYFNIQVGTMWSVEGGGASMAARRTIIRDVHFATLTNPPAIRDNDGLVVPQFAIYMAFNPRPSAPGNWIQSDIVEVYNFNGNAGDDFRVYYKEQDANFIVPQSTSDNVGAPVSGLTNQQAWDLYGIAIAGAVAPSSAITRPDVYGLTVTL